MIESANTRHKKWGVAAIIILTMLIVGCVLISASEKYVITDTPIYIHGSIHNFANDRQIDASVRMFACDNQLYFFSHGANVKKQFEHKLCVFEDSSVHTLLETNWIYALENGYAYYEETNGIPVGDNEHRLYLMSYELATGQSRRIATFEDLWANNVFFDEERVCYIPKDFRLSEYYAVNNGQVSELMQIAESYQLGNKRFTIEYSDLVCFNHAGEKEVLLDTVGLGQICIIPCNSGLLVYNHGNTDLLYYIPEETGEILELFTFEGFSSISAVNMYGDWVYVSFERYAMLASPSPIKYENDTLEGTYRISLRDYSIEKLSDDIYDGMYVFDDTGIYVCKKNGSIYKLDFDGNVIITLLE